tara:strand:+ start:1166 stop:1807 length:642 start_codon:yes stop_codon:yes gene_type:complete
MDEKGYIQYTFEPQSDRVVPVEVTHDINATRTRMREQDFIGKDPNRYGGFSFGNLVKRIHLPGDEELHDKLLVTCSDTGVPDVLPPEDFCVISQVDSVNKVVYKIGPGKPTSEYWSHKPFHEYDETRSSLHTHCPVIFDVRKELEIPCTDEGVEAGTFEMYENMQRLIRLPAVKDLGIIAMESHPDGIFLWGPDFDVVEERHNRYVEMARKLS